MSVNALSNLAFSSIIVRKDKRHIEKTIADTNACSGVEIAILSGVGNFYIHFLNFISESITCNNNLARCGKLIYMSIGTRLGILRQRVRYIFLKCEIKANTTLIYVPVTLPNNVRFDTGRTFLNLMNTFFLLWAKTVE